jgi:hypothetical protein
MDRVAELAEQLVDEAMLRVRQGLGESPISFKAELAAHRAARKLVEAAVEASIGRYAEAAKDAPHLT